MNVVVDGCHLLGSCCFFLGGGGGVKFADPDQPAYFDHFQPISTYIFQGIII